MAEQLTKVASSIKKANPGSNIPLMPRDIALKENIMTLLDEDYPQISDNSYREEVLEALSRFTDATIPSERRAIRMELEQILADMREDRGMCF